MNNTGNWFGSVVLSLIASVAPLGADDYPSPAIRTGDYLLTVSRPDNPPAEDCDEMDEVGRMTSTIRGSLWLCSGEPLDGLLSGWEEYVPRSAGGVRPSIYIDQHTDVNEDPGSHGFQCIDGGVVIGGSYEFTGGALPPVSIHIVETPDGRGELVFRIYSELPTGALHAVLVCAKGVDGEGTG